jgi:hypothetical protein
MPRRPLLAAAALACALAAAVLMGLAVTGVLPSTLPSAAAGILTVVALALFTAARQPRGPLRPPHADARPDDFARRRKPPALGDGASFDDEPSLGGG